MTGVVARVSPGMQVGISISRHGCEYGCRIQFNEHCDDLPAEFVFRHVCKLGFTALLVSRRRTGVSGNCSWLSKMHSRPRTV